MPSENMEHSLIEFKNIFKISQLIFEVKKWDGKLNSRRMLQYPEIVF